MSTLTTKDGTQIYYKDWGAGPPMVFSQQILFALVILDDEEFRDGFPS